MGVERLVMYCQTTSVSAAHSTHCATYWHIPIGVNKSRFRSPTDRGAQERRISGWCRNNGFGGCFGCRSSEHGTCKSVKARFWPWLSGESPENVENGALVSRQRRWVKKKMMPRRTCWEAGLLSRWIRLQEQTKTVRT